MGGKPEGYSPSRHKASFEQSQLPVSVPGKAKTSRRFVTCWSHMLYKIGIFISKVANDQIPFFLVLYLWVLRKFVSFFFFFQTHFLFWIYSAFVHYMWSRKIKQKQASSSLLPKERKLKECYQILNHHRRGGTSCGVLQHHRGTIVNSNLVCIFQ